MIKPATTEQIIKERAIFNEAWRILKKYYNITQDNSDKEWQELIQEADKLYKMPTNASQEKNLSQIMAMTVLEHIEQLAKKRKIENADRR